MRKFLSRLTKNQSKASLSEQPTLSAPSQAQDSPNIQFANLHIDSSKLQAARDNNIYNVVGELRVNKDNWTLLQKLQNVLHPVNAAYDSYEAEQRSRCFENTRVQLLSDIEDWISRDDDQAPIFILDGVAGIGKSTVAQTIAERAAKLDGLGASFFFTRNEEQRTTARYFFATIAFQLARFKEEFAVALDKILGKDPSAIEKSLDQQIKLLILEPLRMSSLSTNRPILIVIDALDECKEEEAGNLLALLANHIRMMPLKLFITARPEWHIRNVLNQDQNHALFHLHEIEESIVQSDIRLYLESTLSAERVQNLFPHRQPVWKPGAKDMDMLCGICGTLFIIASTATRFILDIKALSPEKRLASLLDGVSPSDFSGSKRTDIMDKFYAQIIISAIPNDPDELDEWFERYQLIVGAIIVLQTPLPSQNLAEILGTATTDIEDALFHLHSLVAPTGADATFRVHHKTFPDFVTNEERIMRALKKFRADAETLAPKLMLSSSVHHYRVSRACFRVMDQYLHKNLADLTQEEWYLDKEAISKLDRLSNSSARTYTTLHWAHHLHSAKSLDEKLWKDLQNWVDKHLMSWFEVMCILRESDKSHDILQKVIEFLVQLPNKALVDEKVQRLVSDASRFALQNREVLKVAPMHAYWSALPFAPYETDLVRTYRSPNDVKIISGGQAEWDPALVTVVGHTDWVNAIALSPDAARLVSASNDRTVRIWDAGTGSAISILQHHTDEVKDVVFSPDGSKLATGSGDNSVILWDASTGTHIATLKGHLGYVDVVKFSPNGSRLASASSDRSIRLWDGSSGAHLAVLEGHSGPVHKVAFSPDSLKLASACRAQADKNIRVWDGNTGAFVVELEGHTSIVEFVGFSPDSSKLISGSDDQTVKLWCPVTGRNLMTLDGHTEAVNHVIFSPDESVIVSASDDTTARVWDSVTGCHKLTLTHHSYGINIVEFSPDGRRLATASYDRTICLWDTKSYQVISTLQGHSDVINSLIFFPDSSRLATASDDHTIRLWDAQLRSHASALPRHADAVDSVAFCMNGSKLASGGRDKTVRVWNGWTGAHIQTIEGHSDWVTAVAFSWDGSLLASGSEFGDKTVKVWKTENASHISTFEGHTDYVVTIVFSMDGSRVASATNDAKISVWDRKENKRLISLEGYHGRIHDMFFIDPHGTALLVLSEDIDRLALIWDVATGSHRAIVAGVDSIDTVALDPRQGATGLVIMGDTLFLSTTRVKPAIEGTISLRGILKSVKTLKFIPLLPILPLSRQADGSAVIAGPPLLPFGPDQIRALVFGERANPDLPGLVYIEILPNSSRVVPFCWFPPHINPVDFDIHPSGRTIAIGCADGRVLLLDISSVVFAK